MNFKGLAIYFDGDMVCLSDVKDLIRNLDTNNAINLVKHYYKIKHNIKYFCKNIKIILESTDIV